MNFCVLDFDGTLIKSDSIKLFCRWKSKNYFFYFFYYHIKFRFLSLIKKNYNLKKERFNFFIRKFSDFDKNFWLNILLNDEFDDTNKLINKYKRTHTIVIISASFNILIDEYCKYYGIKYISNTIDYSHDVNFENKLTEFHKKFGKSININLSIGNSSGDYAILLNSKKSYLRNKSGSLINFEL